MIEFFVVLFLAGLLIARFSPETNTQFLKLAILVMAASVLATQLGIILWAPHYHWNHARILPVELFVRGYPLYTEDSMGVVNGNVYGPYAHWFYLPVTFFTDPDVKVMIGSALTALVLSLPAFLLLSESFSSFAEGRLNRWLGFVVFLLFTQSVEPLRMVFRCIHADAPAIGLAALALYFALRHIRTGDRGFLIASCAIAAIAVWAKQNAVVIVPLLPLLIWRFRGRSAGITAGLTMLGVGLIVSLLTILLCRQFTAIYLNLWVIPGSHPWLPNIYGEGFPRLFAFLGAGGQRLQILTEAGIQLLEQFKPLLAAGFLTGVAGWFLNKSNPLGLPRHLLPALLAAGCLLIPMGLLGRVKVGGDLNSFGFPLYFLTLAIVVLLIPVLQVVIKKIRLPQGAWFSLILVVVMAAGGARVASRRLGRSLSWACLPQWGEAEAVAHIKRFGGTAYFPWHPLAHMLAEDQAYHFQYGIFDRDLAGRPVSRVHYAAGIPEQATTFVVPDHPWCIYYTGTTLNTRFNILKEPDRTTLPGWLIFPVQLRD